MSDNGIDIIVPLAGATMGAVWDNGWNGTILAVPIKDYHPLPQRILSRYVKMIADAIREGLTVGILCVGGHGRTGYLAACIVGELRPDLDPIEHVRKVHCNKAIEDKEQIISIAVYLERLELLKHKAYEAPVIPISAYTPPTKDLTQWPDDNFDYKEWAKMWGTQDTPRKHTKKRRRICVPSKKTKRFFH